MNFGVWIKLHSFLTFMDRTMKGGNKLFEKLSIHFQYLQENARFEECEIGFKFVQI